MTLVQHNGFPGFERPHVTRVAGFYAALGQLAVTGLNLGAPGYDVQRNIIGNTISCTVDGRGPDGPVSVRVSLHQSTGEFLGHTVLPF